MNKVIHYFEVTNNTYPCWLYEGSTMFIQGKKNLFNRNIQTSSNQTFYEFRKKKKCSIIKKTELVPWLYTLLTAQLRTSVVLIILWDILVIIIIHLVKTSLSVPDITFFKKLSVFWLWLGVVTKAGARSLWWISTINRACSSLAMATCYTSRAEF